ncbi:MAG: hypothetical protein LBH62_02985, partial [Nitrososphaerota archaeon]|nr:hypothetical protein [Nitrososphaerota archaeon]
IYLTQTGWSFDANKGMYVYPVIGSGSGSGLVVGTTFDITGDAKLGIEYGQQTLLMQARQ